jgi:hypothetical protein
LNEGHIKREWIDDLLEGKRVTKNSPRVWDEWIKTGKYSPLTAEPTYDYRVKNEQLPSSSVNQGILDTIYEYFKDRPTDFEYCAAELVKIMDNNIIKIDVTRPTRDGGRDAIGFYRIGHPHDEIKVEFALEAKCWDPNSSVGVRQTSRLISRLRHRQFGIFVTTSYIGQQAYKEIRQDGHPVIIISGNDIAELLLSEGITKRSEVKHWLQTKFPIA